MFALPNFNVELSFWAPGHTPAADAPDSVFTGQLFLGSRSPVDIKPGDAASFVPPLFIRMAMVTFAVWGPALVGSIFGYIDSAANPERYYIVRWWEITHAGFDNEYVTLLVEQCTNTGAVPDTTR